MTDEELLDLYKHHLEHSVPAALRALSPPPTPAPAQDEPASS
jgi:hypothetical protein